MLLCRGVGKDGERPAFRWRGYLAVCCALTIVVAISLAYDSLFSRRTDGGDVGAPLRGLVGKKKKKDHHPPPPPTKPDYDIKKIIITTDPYYECPEGYEQVSDHECVRTKEEKPKLKCPPGYVLDPHTKTCRGKEQIKPDYVCDTGYEPRGHDCYRQDVEPSQVKCPPGYYLDDHHCVKDVVAPPETACPHGYHYVDGVCVMKVETHPDVQCPYGYVMDEHKKCVSKDTREPLLECPPGYHLGKGGICTKDKGTPVEKRCPPGTHLTPDGICLKKHTVDAHPHCPKEYTLHEGYCYLEEDVPGHVVCDKHYELDAPTQLCTKEDTTHPKLTCPHGYTLDEHAKSCAKTVTKRVAVQPPPPPPPPPPSKKDIHAPMAHHTPHKKDTYVEPAHTKETYSSDDGYDAHGDHGDAGWVIPGDGSGRRELQQEGQDQVAALGRGKKMKKTVTPVAYETVEEVLHEEAQYTCPHGYQLVGKTCTRQLTAKPHTQCPKGMQEIGKGRCLKKSKVAAQYICPDGYAENLTKGKVCEAVKHIKPEMLCPHGSVLDKKTGICEYTDKKEAKEYCPEGYTRHHHHKGECVKVLKEPPVVHCPDGELVGHKCIKRLEEEPTQHCPEGLVFYDGKCKGVKQGKPKFLCPPGYHPKHGECVKDEYAPPRPVCPDGTELKYDVCEAHKEVHPKTYCPKGYKLVNGRCVKQEHARPDVLCPPPYVFDKKKHICVRHEIKATLPTEAAEDILGEVLPPTQAPQAVQPTYVIPLAPPPPPVYIPPAPKQVPPKEKVPKVKKEKVKKVHPPKPKKPVHEREVRYKKVHERPVKAAPAPRHEYSQYAGGHQGLGQHGGGGHGQGHGQLGRGALDHLHQTNEYHSKGY